MEVLDALEAADFEVDVCLSLGSAQDALETEYDLVLLDLGLPDGNGLDLCRNLRRQGRHDPVIILTARDAPSEKVRGLDVGADDYVTKPFHMSELMARVRTVLRRSGRGFGPGHLEWCGLTLDPKTRRALLHGKSLQLTRREFDLLLFLMQHPDRVWTRESLLDRVWGPDYEGDHRTVDLHIRRLRSKVESDPGDPRYIRTVWGVGYNLQNPQPGDE